MYLAANHQILGRLVSYQINSTTLRGVSATSATGWTTGGNRHVLQAQVSACDEVPDQGELWIVCLEDQWAFRLSDCVLTEWQPLDSDHVCPTSGEPTDLLTYEITSIPLEDHGDEYLYQAFARLYEARAQTRQEPQDLHDIEELRNYLQGFPITEEDLDWYETQWRDSCWD